MEDLYVLGIESSCDETSAAVVRNGREVLSNVISTSLPLHKKYGGVVPELASRKHLEYIVPVIDEALAVSGIPLERIGAVGVTFGPGLLGGLLVGLTAAKGICFARNIPLVGVHHLEGHIFANLIGNEDLEPPFVALVASGGHSHIVHVRDYCSYEVLGRTRDDAPGEAYDKVARELGLGYPGGPVIDRISKEGGRDAVRFPRTHFENSFDFSFSGIKTAVLNYVNRARMAGTAVSIPDICASFQEAVCDILCENTLNAAASVNEKTVVLSGGVASNSRLRDMFSRRTARRGMRFYRPEPALCTDNGAMIGAAAYYAFKKGRVSSLDLNAYATLPLDEIQSCCGAAGRPRGQFPDGSLPDR